MSTIPTTSNGAADDGPAAQSTIALASSAPHLPASPASQHAAQDVPPKPKFLDPQWKYEGVPDTQFFKDYPPDGWGEEVAPNARVWKIYRDVLTAADSATLKSWNDTLDVLLIFAGLFSAVSTAFIIESYKFLQPDYTQYVASFLYLAATSSQAANSGTMMWPHVGTLGHPDSFVHPSATQRWTNGLWFTSLVLSLTVALLCILIKQWLDVYTGRTTSSAESLRHWTRRHQLYYRGLNSWGVPALISFLPLLLHASLFLFFAGLVLFLRPLDGTIANTLLSVLILTLLFYVLALVIPALRVECPSYTPLLAQARSVILFVAGFTVSNLARLLSRIDYWCYHPERTHPIFGESAMIRIIITVDRASRSLRSLRSVGKPRFKQETSAICAQLFRLDGWALSTLLMSTNDPDILEASIEAIGAISAEPTLETIARMVPEAVVIDHPYRDFSNTGTVPTAFAALTVARRVRSMESLGLVQSRLTSGRRFRHQPMVDLYPSLGLDGLMIQLMSACRKGNNEDSQVLMGASLRDLLLARLSGLSFGVDSRNRRRSDDSTAISEPNRATALLFLAMQLERAPLGIHLGEYRLPCILLTFCAGDFSQADPHELTLALQTTCSALRETSDATVASTKESPLIALDRFFAILATLELDDATARLVTHHLGLLAGSSLIWRSQWTLQPMRWELLKGFTVFVQQPHFEPNVSTNGLKGYMELLSFINAPSWTQREAFQQYCTCLNTVLRIGCNRALPSDFWEGGGAQILTRQIGRLFGNQESVSCFLEHTTDTTFRSYLEVAGAVGSRTADPMIEGNPFVRIAEGISCLLCRRQRIDPDSALAGLIESLFTGSFLLNQFYRLVLCEPYPAWVKDQWNLQTMTLARHCARLSLDKMLRICDELENPSDAEMTMGEDAVALVGRIRRGLQPGGELRAECDPSCRCMPTAESTITRWRNRVFRRIPGAQESLV